VWVCLDRATLDFGYIADQDKSDEFTVCRRVDDVADVAKLAYYVAKLIALYK
jgi:hypothetical protein